MEAETFQAPDRWTRTTDAQPPKRLDLPATVNFCQYISEPSSDVRIDKRIGSESSQAEVYQITYQDTHLALKLMPITSDADIPKNAHEIALATMASDLVADGTCENFPLVYGSGSCPHVYFFSSKYQEMGQQYSCYHRLRQQLPENKRSRFTALMRQNLPIDSLAQRFSLDPSLCQGVTAHADFLISELAQEDLASWATRVHAVSEWTNIIKQVLFTIEVMRNIMKISHADLHWGNILISTARGRTVALIHDFGQSQELTQDNQRNDEIKFLSAANGIHYLLPKSIRDWFFINEGRVLAGQDVTPL